MLRRRSKVRTVEVLAGSAQRFCRRGGSVCLLAGFELSDIKADEVSIKGTCGLSSVILSRLGKQALFTCRF